MCEGWYDSGVESRDDGRLNGCLGFRLKGCNYGGARWDGADARVRIAGRARRFALIPHRVDFIFEDTKLGCAPVVINPPKAPYPAWLAICRRR